MLLEIYDDIQLKIQIIYKTTIQTQYILRLLFGKDS